MTMSNSRDVTVRRKEVWQEAGSEFYQESYPSGSGSGPDAQPYQSRRSRANIPLPSHTARRNSSVAGRKSGGRRKNSYSALTYQSTMAAGTTNTTRANANDVHVAVMPDLSNEEIPDERTTFDELEKLKTLPVSMAQKRLLKSQLAAIPKLRLMGWENLRWRFTSKFKEWKRHVRYRIKNFSLMQSSLEYIEVQRGVAISNVFRFIKWTMLLNLFTFVLMSIVIVLPYQLGNLESQNKIIDATCPASFNGTLYEDNQDTLRACCRDLYQADLSRKRRGSFTDLIPPSVNLTWSIENSFLFYGYYYKQEIFLGENSFKYRFDAVYGIAILLVAFTSLLIMVRNIGKGLTEVITSQEGDFYRNSNLIFAGWDHCTNTKNAADFKRKVIVHEMKVALNDAEIRFNAERRSHSEGLNLTMMRVGVNIVVLGILGSIAYLVYYASDLAFAEILADDDTEEESFRSILLGLAPSLTISIGNIIGPNILQQLGKLEQYSNEAQLALLIIRSLVVRVLSIGFTAARFYTAAYCHIKENSCLECADKDRLRKPCWESLCADQLYKIVVVDFCIKVFLTFVLDPLRVAIGKLPSKICKRVGTISFNICKNSLDIIYIQMLSWIGVYFSPTLPLLATVYCYFYFQMKKFSVLTLFHGIPDTYRTTRSTSIFVLAKFLSFIFVLLITIAILGNMRPSIGCGPMYSHRLPWNAVSQNLVDSGLSTIIARGLTAPSLTGTLCIILFFVNYYYYSIAQTNRKMVETFRHLLVLEGHDKQFLFGRLNHYRELSHGKTRESDHSE